MEWKVWKFALIVICASLIVSFSSFLFLSSSWKEEDLVISLARLQCTPPAFFWEHNTRSERGRVRPREQKEPREDFAVRTIINGFDLNFLFVWPPLMFLLVDRLLSCNLFFSLFIYFSLPPLPPFRLFGSYWSIEWKKVSTSVKIHGWLWKGFF